LSDDEKNPNELERNTALAAQRHILAPSSIINAAKILDLNPLPTGETDGQWHAVCPGTTHKMIIVPESNRWNCYECNCGGDVDDLETLWRQRRPRAA